MNMNKKIIGLLFTAVSVSFSCTFAMDFGPYAPNDPAVVAHYYELFKQEEDKRREEEQARAQKEQEKRAPSHDAQMQEYATRHRKRLADLEKNGQVLVVAQESNSQGVDTAVVAVEDLVDSLTSSMQGFVISTKKESEKSKAESQMIGKKRNQGSRPDADDCDPKRKPLTELFEEVLNLHEENELREDDREPVVVVIQQELGQKRKNHNHDFDFSDPNAKRSKKE